MKKPLNGDYDPYFETYISEVKNENIIRTLEFLAEETEELLKNLNEEKADFSYSRGKWNIKEVLGHVIDTERVMAYRAMCIARGEKQKLPGFNHEDYVNHANIGNRTLPDLLNEMIVLRKSTLLLMNSLDEKLFDSSGIVDNKRITVAALFYIIAGHHAHHLKILKERYLN